MTTATENPRAVGIRSWIAEAGYLAGTNRGRLLELFEEALATERRLLLDRLQERLYVIPTHGKSALYFRAAMDETLDIWRMENPAAPPLNEAPHPPEVSDE